MTEIDRCILGVTMTGERFRPSDWPERLCGVVASVIAGPQVQGSRALYSAYARPVMLGDRKCVLVLGKLREANAMAYDFLFRFAEDNALRVCSRAELERDASPSIVADENQRPHRAVAK